MTSIERTAYPRFKRLITARELHVFFTPSEEERVWAEEVTDSDEHQLALLVALKSYQRMGCFPKAYDVPAQVVEFVRRAAELPEDTLPVYGSERTAKSQRSMVRQRCQVRYDGPAARALAEETMRVEAASKNNPADLINIALEKLVEAGLEIPRFFRPDAMASTVRGQVHKEILTGIRDRMTTEERARLLGLADVIGLDGKTLFNALKQNPGRATWSHFKRLKGHLEWVDGLGDPDKWLEWVASAKVADFAGEAEAQDAGTLKDCTEGRRVALIACLAAKARMRARDDVATMFCKRMAAKAKKAREELAEIHRQQQEIVEKLIGNYRTLLQQVDQEGPAQRARARAKGPRKSAERLEQAIKERMPERSLLGIVARTAYWIEWWHRFGPASGNDPKLKDPFGRYVITTFVKGTNMTFAEAARHIAGVSAHELSVAARQHTTTAKLNEALTDVVNAHAKLDMSRAWGNGTTSAADGTHMDTYLDNLLAETSVRYGAVGGIAYHHISDLYIALFTHFVPCGVREAVYIIEAC